MPNTLPQHALKSPTSLGIVMRYTHFSITQEYMPWLYYRTAFTPPRTHCPIGSRLQPNVSSLMSFYYSHTRTVFPPQKVTHSLFNSSVILCVDRPILSLILSFRLDTRAEDDKDTSKGRPTVGRTRTLMERERERSRFLWLCP